MLAQKMTKQDSEVLFANDSLERKLDVIGIHAGIASRTLWQLTAFADDPESLMGMFNIARDHLICVQQLMDMVEDELNS
jgi:hypothetical protein